jgi:tetratricopeptide (TPR) repeat protein
MKGRPIRRMIATLVFLFFVLSVLTIGAERISAQQPTPTLGAPTPTLTPIPTSDLERRIYKLEVTQAETIRSWESTGTQTRNITAAVGVLFTILVIFQGYATHVQLGREGRALESRLRTEGQAREIEGAGVEQVSRVMNVVRQTLEDRLEIERMGIGQVSEIMSVVQKTLESHLRTEERADEMVKKVEERLAKALEELSPLQRFYPKFQAAIGRLRRDMEERAFQLAQISRHHFRGKTDDLKNFAQQFDMFTLEFEALEEEREGEQFLKFTPRVLYIRGIAAHYDNQPEIAKQYLEQVVHSRKPESDEDPHACDRRVANAYYYLGLTQSNLGNYPAALNFFEKANELDPKAKDFLTRIATAEANVMVRNFEGAKDFITQVETGVLATQRDKDGRLLNFYLRLQSRAVLIRANIVILKREADWHDKARPLLERVHAEDPQYYYATATLAQVYYDQGNPDEAQKLFSEAYRDIERSGHLLAVTEARSGILLLMVAGMCCKHGFQEDKWSKEYLDKAYSLIGSLPKMGFQTCTAFSTLSKRNESSDTIRHHIELIREGKVLL